ncbi:bifunctional transcriptional activator/DNA repair enzyme AdaA [Oceanobacillus jeddahense]
MPSKITAEQRKAIIENDKAYDGQFFYGVKTTKIFCRPSCKSRVPNFDNVTIFRKMEDALQAGYRPCKRCKSGGANLPDEEWVLQAEAYMKENYARSLTLSELAEAVHGSPYHLHRVFRRLKGITPLAYLQQIRMQKAKDYLIETPLLVKEIASLVGISNPARFTTVFKEKNHLTPRQFRMNYGEKVSTMKNKQTETIYYGKLEHNGWSFYLAATDKGLCYVGSQNNAFDEIENWTSKKRKDAMLVQDEEKVSLYKEQLISYLDSERTALDLPIDLNGTAFQESVWNELQNIPYGETVSYMDIAEKIGKPKAVRAVGAAIGANPVMILVPCHRVLAKDGKLTGFRGGIPMKEALLALESKK